MAAIVQPAPSSNAPDPAAELRSTLAARVALETLWQKFVTDSTAAQDQAVTTVASAQTFVDFSTQMDKIIQSATDFKTAKDKKDAEALSDAGETIDEACEQCHLKYWYPLNTPDALKKGSVKKTS